jgi:uncharacterized protein YijF (DUF1287 family)
VADNSDASRGFSVYTVIMRYFAVILLPFFLAGCGERSVQTPPLQVSQAPAPRVASAVEVASSARPLVQAARERLAASVVYDGRYVGIDYPGGDVDPGIGVCTDVVIRSYRAAHGFDLQKVVHEDMRADFDAYPTNWGHTRPDKNIDHRRVPNLEVWFTRAGHALPITQNAADYRPGDVVSWRLSGDGVPHIGIISDRVAADGTPLIIHNIGRGPEEDNMLFAARITGHFRFAPETAP